MSQELVVALGSQARVTGLQVGEPSSHMPSLCPARLLPQGPLYQTYPKAQVATPAMHCLFNASHAHVFSFNLFNLPDQSVKQITNPHSSLEEAVLREVKLSTNISRFII